MLLTPPRQVEAMLTIVSGKLGSTVVATTDDLPQTSYATILIDISARSYHSNRCGAIQQHSIETRHGQRTRQKHDEEDGRW
jgi:hypothetical protein